MNIPLRIEITDDARTHIAAAVAWWAENRPAAPGAILEDLDRILDLLSVQPAMGTRARRAKLSGVRRIALLRIGTTCTTEYRTMPFRFLRFGTPVAARSQGFERQAAEHRNGADAPDRPCHRVAEARGSFRTLGRQEASDEPHCQGYANGVDLVRDAVR